jgi:hypothetical protein
MTEANGTNAIIEKEWPYFVWLYVEEYVRSLMKIELIGVAIQPWWYELEANVFRIFRPYNVTIPQLIQKYAVETLRLSGCVKHWHASEKYTVWPFVDTREQNDRCMYITHELTFNQTLTNQLNSDIVLQSCNSIDFHELQHTGLKRIRVLSSLSPKLSQSRLLFNQDLLQCNLMFFLPFDSWCNGYAKCPTELTGMCAKCQEGLFHFSVFVSFRSL